MYLRDFPDGFDQLVAFDAETTGKRTPDAEFIYKPLPGESLASSSKSVSSRCCATEKVGAEAICGAPGSPG